MSGAIQGNNKSYTAVITSCVLFGMVGIFVKGINNMETTSILFYRLLFGLGAIILYLKLIGKLNELRLGKKRNYVLLLGVLNTITLFTYFSALKYSSLAVAVLLLYTAPVYVTLLSPLILKERITLKNVFALTISISGIVLIVNPGEFVGSFSGEGSYLLGILCGLVSGLSYGCSIMTVNYLKEDYSGVAQMFWSTAVSLLLFLPFGVSVPAGVLLDNLKTLVPLGIIATALAYVLYFSGVVHIKAQTAAVLAFLEPVSCIFFGYAVLGEPIYASTIEGCAFILFGAFLIGSNYPILSRPRVEYLGKIQGKMFPLFMPHRPGKL